VARPAPSTIKRERDHSTHVNTGREKCLWRYFGNFEKSFKERSSRVITRSAEIGADRVTFWCSFVYLASDLTQPDPIRDVFRYVGPVTVEVPDGPLFHL